MVDLVLQEGPWITDEKLNSMKMRRNIKKIFFDFETTCSNPHKTNLFQATFIFTDENNQVIDKLNEYVKINPRYENFSEEEKQALLDVS